jgi:diguanylate cyclase (GGDEF)-like protein/PAS domain S-box-containing protein
MPNPVHFLAEVSLADPAWFAAMLVLALTAIAFNGYMAIRFARLSRALRESEERWKFALEGAGDGVWDWNVQTDAVVFSPRYLEMYGYRQEDIVADEAAWQQRIHPEDRARVAEDVHAYLGGSTSAYVNEHRVFCRDGSVKWVLARGMIVSRDAQGRPLRMIGTHADITARKASEEQVRHLAHYDALTDLPNRALISDRLQQAVAKARRDGTVMAVMFLDLDQFKPVNDNLGHDVGDLLLKQVSQRLLSCMRESDTVARIGGDEFVVLLPQIEREQDAIVVAEKIRTALHQPFTIAGHRLQISSSIGIAAFPAHGSDDKLLLLNADLAMYHAKKNGRNSYQFYDAAMQYPLEQPGALRA